MSKTHPTKAEKTATEDAALAAASVAAADAPAAFLVLAADAMGSGAMFVPRDIHEALDDWQIDRALASVGLKRTATDRGDEGVRLTLAPAD